MKWLKKGLSLASDHRVLLIAALFSLLYWFIDAAIDFLVYAQYPDYFGAVFLAFPHDRYARYTVALLFLVFATLIDYFNYRIRVDIAERKRIQTELLDRQDRLTLAIQSAELGVWDWDIANDLVEGDERWAGILNVPPGLVCTNRPTWLSHIHSEDRADEKDRMDEHLQGLTSFYESEFRVGNDEESWRWVLCQGRVIERDARGEPLRMIGVVRDLTTHRYREKILKDLTHTLGERIKELDCLYSFSQLVEREELTLEEVLQEVVNLLPPAMQYPEQARARLALYDKEYATQGYRPSPYAITEEIHVHDAQMGTLEVLYMEIPAGKMEDLFFKEEFDLVRDIADRIGDLVEKRQAQLELHESIRGRTRELSALYDVAAMGNRLLAIEDYLNRALDTILEKTGSQAGMIHLLDEEESHLKLCVYRGIEADTAALLSNISLEDGFWRRLLHSDSPSVYGELQGEPDSLTARPTNPYPAFIGVPIRTSQQRAGTLSVMREDDRDFEPEEITFLSAIADHLGLSIERNQLRIRAEKAAVIEERQRLARDLHDSVTQSLSSLNYITEAALRSVQRDQDSLERLIGMLEKIGSISRSVLKELRLLIYELQPVELVEEGLAGALQQRLNAVENRSGLQAELVVEETEGLHPVVEEALYRIAQEALSNALRHAAADRVVVYLRNLDNQVELEITDDGQGFNPQTVVRGMGLNNMQIRASFIGGDLRIQSAPGNGTRVFVCVPRDKLANTEIWNREMNDDR